MKRAMGSDLINALRSVARGGTFVDPAVASVLIREIGRRDARPEAGPSALTPREEEILDLIGQGKTGPEIARALYLSTKTVSWHRANIMMKLDVHSTAALVRYALERGQDTDGP